MELSLAGGWLPAELIVLPLGLNLTACHLENTLHVVLALDLASCVLRVVVYLNFCGKHVIFLVFLFHELVSYLENAFQSLFQSYCRGAVLCQDIQHSFF